MIARSCRVVGKRRVHGLEAENGRQRVRGWDSDAILSDMKKLSRLNHRTAKFAEISDMSTRLMEPDFMRAACLRAENFFEMQRAMLHLRLVLSSKAKQVGMRRASRMDDFQTASRVLEALSHFISCAAPGFLAGGEPRPQGCFSASYRASCDGLIAT